jgi:aryl-alcohol dehydrogenase-like predicted oxidoreductase
LHRPVVTSVILGAKRVDQLSDTLGAVDVSLSDEEIGALNAVTELPGEYPGWMLTRQAGLRTELLEAQRR